MQDSREGVQAARRLAVLHLVDGACADPGGEGQLILVKALRLSGLAYAPPDLDGLGYDVRSEMHDPAY